MQVLAVYCYTITLTIKRLFYCTSMTYMLQCKLVFVHINSIEFHGFIVHSPQDVKVRSHYSEWPPRMLIRSQTLIYGRGMLGISRVCSEYVDIFQCTFVLHAEIKLFFWTWSKFISVCERIQYTLLIR